MERVCSNSYNILQEPRFFKKNDFYVALDTHFRIFAGCGSKIPFSLERNERLRRLLV